MTGEVSLAGKVRGIGGVVEKLYAARAASMRAFVLPAENAREIEATPGGIAVVPVATIADAMAAYGLRPPAVPHAPGRSARR